MSEEKIDSVSKQEEFKERFKAGGVEEAIEGALLAGDQEALIQLFTFVNDELTGLDKAHFKDEETLTEEVNALLTSRTLEEEGYGERTFYLGDGIHRISVWIDGDEAKVILGSSSLKPLEDISSRWESLK